MLQFARQGFIATRCGLLSLFTAGNKQIMARTGHVATDNISSIKVAFANWYVAAASSTGELNNTGTATITASVEYPAGTFTQILFSGSSSGTAAAGANLWSDYTNVSIPNGATFWIREFYNNPSGVLYNGFRNAGLGDLTTYAVSGLTDQTMGGTITNSAGTLCRWPLAIIGTTSKCSLLVIGDSISFGTNDTASAADGRVGIICKSLPSTLGFVNVANFGARATTFLANATARSELFPYCTHLVTQLGFNDITHSISAATTLTAIQNIWSQFSSTVKKTQTLITPYTSSSDSWATAGNQTLQASEAVRQTLNTSIRAIPAGLNNGTFEVSRPLESSPDNGIWVCTPTPPYTPDGIHPALAGYDLVASSGAVDLSRFNMPYQSATRPNRGVRSRCVSAGVRKQ